MSGVGDLYSADHSRQPGAHRHRVLHPGHRRRGPARAPRRRTPLGRLLRAGGHRIGLRHRGRGSRRSGLDPGRGRRPGHHRSAGSAPNPSGTVYNGAAHADRTTTTPPTRVSPATSPANGTAPASPAGDHDVDGGCTTLLTPVFDLCAAERAFVTYWRWFGQDGFTVDDDWLVEVTNDGGASWVERRDASATTATTGITWPWSWVPSAAASTSPTRSSSASWPATCGGGGLVEAAIDDFDLLIFMGDTTPVEDRDARPADRAAAPEPAQPLQPGHQHHLRAAARRPTSTWPCTRVDGRRVATLAGDLMPAGEHTVTWRRPRHGGRRVASGAYFYRLMADGQLQVKRMVMVK